jgi:hypothetical protein
MTTSQQSIESQTPKRDARRCHARYKHDTPEAKVLLGKLKLSRGIC